MRAPMWLRLLTVTFGSYACAGSLAEESQPRPAEASRQVIVVSRPTVVAYFATTQGEIDADGGAGEAIFDFQHYLPGQRSGLARMGIHLVETYADTLVIRSPGVRGLLVPRGRSSDVGYLLVAPGRAWEIMDGVATDVDLVAAAERYFSHPADTAAEPATAGGAGPTILPAGQSAPARHP